MRIPFLSVAIVALSTPARADCTADVNAAFDKLRTSKAFQLETRITSPQGKMKMTVDYNPPDRMHQRIRLDEVGQPMELIVIGAEAWSNQGQGWVPLPEQFSAAVSKQVQDTLNGAMKGASSYECKGEEQVEGKTVKKFEADLAAAPADPKAVQAPAPAKPNRQTLYVDAATGLPVRNVVTDGNDPGKRLFDGAFIVSEAIDIKPPELSR